MKICNKETANEKYKNIFAVERLYLNKHVNLIIRKNSTCSLKHGTELKVEKCVLRGRSYKYVYYLKGKLKSDLLKVF